MEISAQVNGRVHSFLSTYSCSQLQDGNAKISLPKYAVPNANPVFLKAILQYFANVAGQRVSTIRFANWPAAITSWVFK
jgi:hypothetical protein